MCKVTKNFLQHQIICQVYPIGTFKNSVRAYREYKKEWRAKMEVKLAQMEEEIRQAKNDPFYKVETV